MKIRNVWIKHFTSIEDVRITFEDTLALVGQNNAGKSNILKAVELLFDPSSRRISQDSFFGGDIHTPIEITAEFSDLSPEEKGYFSSYVQDSTLKIRRRIEWDENTSKVTVHHIGFSLVPKQEWLDVGAISGDDIERWWPIKDTLVVGGVSFAEYLGSRKPTVSSWKESAQRFIDDHRDIVVFEEKERDNARGYEGVLKGGLPKFIFIPAVQDVLDETKVEKTNPFGELVGSMLSLIPPEQKATLQETLGKVAGMVNRESGSQRIEGVTELESKLNSAIGDLMPNCTLELRIPTPRFEEFFDNVHILIDDGFKGGIEKKGQGLQRYVIFAILKTYAESLRQGEGRRRSTFFAIEEPEIYLHPQAQRVMHDVLFKIGSQGDQVAYSTHSSLLVDMTFFDRLCLVTRNQAGGGYRTEVRQLPMNALLHDLKARYPETNPTPESMRSHYSHVYNHMRNEGFFAKKVILVEGLSEEYAIPIYGEAVGYHMDREGVSVISTGGKGSMDRLFRVFNEFGIPCYLLFDGDSDKNEPGNVRQTKELLKLFGCEQEHPFLTRVENRFAMFKNDFEDIMSSEVSDYGDLVREARRELGLQTDAGKPLIARYVATKLTGRGEAEGSASKYVPPTMKAIIEKCSSLQWEQSVLQ